MSDNCRHCGHATCGCAAVYAQGVADERARIEGIVKKMIQEEDEDDDGAEWFPWNSLDEILRRIRDKERPT